jgi:quinol monooxygenase YgiN
MNRLVEIRTYKLKPGSGAAFHALVASQSVPLLAQWGMEVVAFGQSEHDPDGYYLIRAYESMEHLRSSQEAFYASPAWRQGPREAIVSLIEADANAVLWLSPEAIAAIRSSQGRS